MDEWQIKHITKNLPQLIPVTKFNVIVKAELVAQKCLSKADVDKLNALQTQHGQSEASYEYYQFLMGRTNAYKVLTKALHENRQTGAARILIDGVPKAVSDQPLTHLGIPIKWDGLKDMEIEVNGRKQMLHKFLPNVNSEKLQQIFQDTVSELEIYDAFVTRQRTFVLSKNTLPPKPPFYISRLLSNRIKVDESIFKADCLDVFVFKNSIARYKLSQIARPHFTADSTSQLANVSSRFIYLDENEDWIELKKIAKEPIHLINCEANSKTFILEDSSAPSNILKKLGSESKRVYMSEVDFVQQQLSEECTSSIVCICDTPGMGKSFLLANIARHMTDHCAGRIIVFIQLILFAQDFCFGSVNTLSEPEISLTNVLSYTCPPTKNLKLLLQLVKAKLIVLKVLFDGLDELSKDKVEWTKQIFRSITTNFSNVRIYITSRPHMRQELESSLGVVAYEILPFTQQNQVEFLVRFWQNTELDSYQPSLQTYATRCLETVSNSLSKNDREIAGIPLLCQLIAEIYAGKLAFHTINRRNLSNVSLQIFGMYQKFIQKKINIVTQHKTESDDIKLILVWHALKLLFPKNDFHENGDFNNVNDMLQSPKILKTGILHKHSNSALEFIHRTFAEYLVAEYFLTTLQDKEMQKTRKINNTSISILELLLKCQKTEDKYMPTQYNFLYAVIVSFFNSAFGEENISEEMKIQGAAYISSISSKAIISILCASCQHNLFNIFHFLKESLTKCDTRWFAECFTDENSYELLSICIRNSTSQFFHSCIKLLTDKLKLDMSKIHIFCNREHKTLIQLAVNYANYEAVEYLMEWVSLKNQEILGKCVQYRNDIEKRENILRFLLNRDSKIIHEDPNILVAYCIDMRLFKILVKIGVNLNAVYRKCNNCVMLAAEYMSPSSYNELVQFLLTDCKAEYLFLKNEKWAHPLPFIIEKATILPETLELLLNIPGNDIKMKNNNGENLLFSAANGNKVSNFQQLVNRGLDYTKKGMNKRSLLHAAAENGGLEMVRYLLSLNLDPNYRDKNNWTPLHFAARRINRQYVLEVIVENGINVHAKTNQGQTAIHLCAKMYHPSLEVIRYLIGKGIGVNDRDHKGNTPLHLCKRKHVRIFLIKMGADIHAKNKKGLTSVQMNPDLWKSNESSDESIYKLPLK